MKLIMSGQQVLLSAKLGFFQRAEELQMVSFESSNVLPGEVC